MLQKLEYPFELINGKLWQSKPAKWSSVIRYLKEYAVGKKASVCIPVTKSSFDNYYSFSNNENPFIRRYDNVIQRFIDSGYLLADAQIESNLIRVSYCIDGGCGADSDGYGMEPPSSIIAILDWSGNFVVSFTEGGLCYYFDEFTIIDHLIELGIPALNEQGKINAKCKQTADKRYQKVFIGGLCGMLAYSSNIRVPCLYKNVELLEKLNDRHYSFCVQTTDNRYGLYLPYSKKENIPAIYYSPFKIIDNGILESTKQDGSEVRFEIKETSSYEWAVNELTDN